MTSDKVAINDTTIARASEIVRRGGLVVYPTDTVYGLGCDPFNKGAVRRLFEVKGRGRKPIPVLCSSASKAEVLVILSKKAKALASANWPGALTIVAPMRRSFPQQLTQGSSNLGVRVPSPPLTLKLIHDCGGWLTGTSANLTGRPSARSAEEAMTQIGGLVDLVLDGGTGGGEESTVVRVVGDTLTILRTGPVGVGSG